MQVRFKHVPWLVAKLEREGFIIFVYKKKGKVAASQHKHTSPLVK